MILVKMSFFHEVFTVTRIKIVIRQEPLNINAPNLKHVFFDPSNLKKKNF